MEEEHLLILVPEQLDEVITMIKATFPNFSSDAEISCEVDPLDFLTKEHYGCY